MRLSRKKILALCMSGALVLASIPGMYVKSVAAKKNNSPVIRLNTTSIKIVKGKKKTLKVTVKNVKKLKKVTYNYANHFSQLLFYIIDNPSAISCRLHFY